MSRVIVEAFRQLPVSIMITDSDRRILFVNSAFSTLTGFSADEVKGHTPRILHSGRHDQTFYREMWDELTRTDGWAGEIWNRRKNGELFLQWLAVRALRGPSGKQEKYVAVMTDITRRKHEELRNVERATHDSLTGLPNRALFLDRLSGACLRAYRHNEKAALLFLDLDRFKLINDTLGHHAGDQILRDTAERLLSCVRESDTVARIGGDEFMIILANVNDTKYAEAVAGKILAELAQPFRIIGGKEEFISGSIGIASVPSDSTVPEQLIKCADMAMYLAKDEGRNNFRFYSDEMNTTSHQRLALLRELHRAIDALQMKVHYQPITETESGLLVGAEALLRWKRSDGSLVSAAEFIGLAEESGLIIPIGDTVLERVVDDMVSWRAVGAPPIRVSINLSRRQLRDSMAFEKIRNRLLAADIPPDALEFEISEAVLSEEMPTIQSALQKLSGFGVGLAVDDFGTGYTSLKHLRRMTVTTLKIDRLFIRNMLDDMEDHLLTSAIISMAHSLGIRIVAEGVENEAQRERLRRLNCDFMQGYLVSQPLESREFIDFLQFVGVTPRTRRKNDTVGRGLSSATAADLGSG